MVEDDSFLSALGTLLEHNSIVIKGKSLLCFAYLMKHNSYWVGIVHQIKLYTFLDRLLRDNFKYVKYCLYGLVEIMAEISSHILNKINDDFSKLIKGETVNLPNGGAGDSNSKLFKLMGAVLKREKIQFPASSGNIIFINVLLNMIHTQSLKTLILSHSFIKIFSNFIQLFEINHFTAQVSILLFSVKYLFIRMSLKKECF